MTRLTQQERFEIKTQRRREAVKHMKERLRDLKRMSGDNKISDFEYNTIMKSMAFLSDVVDRTTENLIRKRKPVVTSLAVESVNDEEVHIHDGERSSLAGLSDMLAA